MGHRVAHVAGYRPAGAVVAALLDPAGEILDGGRPGIEGDGRRLCDGIRLDVKDARPVPEHAFCDGLLAGVVEPADMEDGRGGPRLRRLRYQSATS